MISYLMDRLPVCHNPHALDRDPCGSSGKLAHDNAAVCSDQPPDRASSHARLGSGATVLIDWL
jgi:hypothetical protein